MNQGQVLGGRYRLVRQLGEGGLGVVWAAEQVTTGRQVAIKLLKEEQQADVSRFLREARLASQIAHPNIVQIFDFWDGREGTPAFMVMELLSGESLAARLHRLGRLSPAQTADIVMPIVRALEAAHAAGVVHRDLKPDNVFISPGSPEVVKVLDFGIAKPTNLPADQTQLTRTGTVLGTPRYMSPEQVYGEHDIDGRSDIWSLGCLIYECLVGMTPFDGDNYGQIFRGITDGKRISVQAAVRDVPPAFEALVMRMLTKERDARPSLAEVARVLAGGAMSLPPPPALQQATQVMAPPPSFAPRPPASRAPAAIGLVAVAAAALGGIVWYVRAPGPAPAKPDPPAVVSSPSPSAPAPAVSEIAIAPSSAASTVMDAGRPQKPGRKPRPSASSAASSEPVDPLDQGRF